MVDFYDDVGRAALGSRLRRLSERMAEQAVDVYAMYETELDPTWFPVFFALVQSEPQSVTQLAERIGQSHVSVSKTVRALTGAGLVTSSIDETDRRVRKVRLSDLGGARALRLRAQMEDIEAAVDELLAEAAHDLWEAVREMETLLGRASLSARIRGQFKRRHQSRIEIVPYAPEYKEAFAALNYAWIEQFFEVEPSDQKALDAPDENIIAAGGDILMAKLDGEVVGTCALLKKGGGEYELAKMAVAETAQGRGVGLVLGRAVLERARALGATRVFLESNTKLEPALNLYRKLGFQRVHGRASPYDRCNIQMEHDLTA